MKKIILLTLLLGLLGCSQGSDDKDNKTPDTSNNASEYYAEYGIPNQNLIQACSGDKDLVRPITKCVKRANNSQVDVSLCYNLPPVYMTIPSPNGQRQTQISGGFRLDTCEEGSTDVIATSYLCNVGFFLQGIKCFSYETVGSYAIQKDQFYKSKDGLKLLMTLGNDFGAKEKDGLKLIMLLE